MSQTESLSLPGVLAGKASLVGNPVRTDLSRCLIIGCCRDRVSMFVEAAAAAGWHAVVTSDLEAASELLASSAWALALVDLEGGGEGATARSGLPQLLERMAADRSLLVIVCGHHDNAAEELWVRQLGVWLYLPGVVESSDVTALCGEARLIAERLQVSPNGSSGSVGTARRRRTKR